MEIWIAGAVFLLWLLALRSWGRVREVSAEGFVFSPFLGPTYLVGWTHLRPGVAVQPGPFPRVEFRLRDEGFLSLMSWRLVFLRHLEVDAELVRQVRERGLVAEVVKPAGRG